MQPLEALRPRWVVSAPKLIFMPLKLAENPFFGLFRQNRRNSESFRPIGLKFEHNLALTIL